MQSRLRNRNKNVTWQRYQKKQNKIDFDEELEKKNYLDEDEKKLFADAQT